MSLRLAFMGTPEFASPALAAIVDAGHEVVVVYSQPPRAAGRGLETRKSPVHIFAESHGIEVRTPVSLRDEAAWSEFAGDNLDAAIVVAYGLILPQAILDSPVHGCLNLHGSLLPRWRGAAPIQRAIMAGDEQTGIAVMQMEAGLDTGPVCLETRLNIDPDMTASVLHDRLASAGGKLITEALEALEAGSLSCVAQSANGVTYAKKIEKSETRIDWSRPAAEVHNHIRGLSSYPGAWFELPTPKGPVRVKVLATSLAGGKGKPGEVLDEQLSIACGGGALRLVKLQRAGKAPMDAEAFARGAALMPGVILN